MAPRLNRRHPPPLGFPSWAEFTAVCLLVIWLVGLVAHEGAMTWVHLLIPAAFGILAFSFWNNRSPRGDS